MKEEGVRSPVDPFGGKGWVNGRPDTFHRRLTTALETGILGDLPAM